MRGQVLIAATAFAALAVFSQPASAQPYSSYHDEHVATQRQCERARNNNTVAGALIGGIAGAVLGSNSAGRGHRGDGTALGAVVGAAAGGAIGRSSTRCDRVPQGSYDPYGADPYGRGDYPGGYRRGDDYGLEGGPYEDSSYRGGDYGRDCCMGSMITRDRRGREHRERMMMCRGRDGTWRPRDH